MRVVGLQFFLPTLTHIDNITIDHLSPSNAIMASSAAGEYLAAMGLPEEDFNSYATHRGDHLTAQRATFANPKLINEMAVVEGADGKREVKQGLIATLSDEEIKAHPFYSPDAMMRDLVIGDADTVMMAAIEAGAEDVESSEDGHIVYCADTDLNDVSNALEAELGESDSTKLIWKPTTTTELDLEGMQKLMRLVDALEDDDDVQRVTTNFEASDEVMAQL